MAQRVSDEKLKIIRESNPIQDVVGEYIDIHKKGRNYTGVCPFHDDTSPSLVVSPDKQIFKCFACGAGGNVFSFVQRYKTISFLETVRELAKRSGIEISELNNLQKVVSYDKESLSIFEINEEAMQYFKYNLENNEQAKNFAATRHLDEKMIQKFDIGFTTKDTSLINFLVSKGYEKSDIIKAGLANQSDDGRVYEIFFNRLMFPIKNEDGKVIGFSGRVISGDEKSIAKYLNTHETHVFKKSELLYNVEKIKHDPKASKEVFVTEGFMDVIALSRIGVNNAVAIMGTAFSEANIKRLRKTTKNIVLSFDNDKAGIKATFDAAEKIMKDNVRVEVLDFDNKYKDLDELISNNTIEDSIKVLDKKLTPIDFKIERLSSILDLSNPINKKKMIDELKSIMNLERDNIYRQSYLNKISNILEIDKNEIEKEFQIIIQNDEVQHAPLINEDVEINLEYRNMLISIYSKIEINLLKQAMNDKSVYDVISAENYNIWWKKKHKVLWLYIEQYYQKNNLLDISAFIDSIEDEDIKQLVISEMIDPETMEIKNMTIFNKEEVLDWLKVLTEQEEVKKDILK